MPLSSFWFAAPAAVAVTYPTLNPESATDNADMTLSEGNLRAATTVNNRTLTATMATGSSGGYYFEVKVISYASGGGLYLGLTDTATHNDANVFGAGKFVGFSSYAGTYDSTDSGSAASDTNDFSGTDVSSNDDVWQFALDATNDKFWIGKNNTWADGTTPSIGGSGHTSLGVPRGALYPFISRAGSYNETYQFNFGAPDFAHTPPTGFAALTSATKA